MPEKLKQTTLAENGIPLLGSPIHDREVTKTGYVVGYRRCTLEGCGSTCLGTRWEDGKLTWLCCKGLGVATNGNWKVGS